MIITGTKIGGMRSFTVETERPAMVYGTTCTITQTPSGEIIIGKEET